MKQYLFPVLITGVVTFACLCIDQSLIFVTPTYADQHYVSKSDFSLLKDEIDSVASDVRDIKNHLLNEKE